MNVVVRSLLVAAIVAASVRPAMGTPVHPRAGTTGAAFLSIPVGPRPGAMAGAYTSISDDVFGLAWNPAGIAYIERNQIGFEHMNWLDATNMEYLAGAMKWTEKTSLGLSARLLSVDDIQRRSGTGQLLSTYGATDFAVGPSIATRFGDAMTVGASVYWIHQSRGTLSGNAFSADLGGIYREKGKPWSLGASVRNVGTDVNFTGDNPLPWEISGGGSYRLMNDRLLLTADISKPYDNFTRGRFGAEYRVFDLLTARVGYLQAKDVPASRRFGGGAGFNFGNFQLDYAYVPAGELGFSHKMGLTWGF